MGLISSVKPPPSPTLSLLKLDSIVAVYFSSSTPTVHAFADNLLKRVY